MSVYKILKRIILMSLILLSITLSLNSLDSLAMAQKVIKQEALINLNFTGSALKEISNSIRQDIGQINQVQVTSISSLIDLDGENKSAQTFTKSNDETQDSIEFLNNYSKTVTALFSVLPNLKSKLDAGQTIENQDQIKPLLAKYSGEKLSKAKKQFNNKNLKISSITILGSYNHINQLKTGKTGKITSTQSYLDVAKAQKQSEIMKVKIDQATTIEAKDAIMREGLREALSNANLPQVPSLNLTDQEIKAVDELVKRDPSGNIFVTLSDLNKTNINPSQFAGIISAMNSYNQLPTEVKDGSMQAIQSLGQSEIVKTEERNQAELTDKIAQVLVGSLKVEAGGCSNQYYNWGMYWWGVRLRTSKCFGEDLKNTGAISSYGSQLAGGFCIVASVLAGAGVISCGLFMAIWWSVSWKMFTLGQAIIYNSDRCRQRWVTADIQYTSNFSVVC